MNCNELVERVTDCLEEALDPDSLMKLLDHLQICVGCDNYFNEVLVTLKVISKLPDTSVPNDTETKLLAVYDEWTKGATV
ncbi:MAG TPA: hypothetical protein VFM37_10030 [Pseudonocardiaceae bacterium]|nr:hypothetical protein [Pseudonocardiaceae bacterium]